MIEGFILASETFFTFNALAAVLIGVILGVFAGATPGISPAMAVALLVPFSFGLDPVIAFVLFVAVYQAANYGGSVTAITINTPGTASAMVTGMEGYPLFKKGKGGEALTAALFSSVFGGIIGALCLIAFAVPAGKIAIKFSPFHYFCLASIAVLTIIIFAGKGWQAKVNATIAVTLGMLIAAVGLDNFSGQARFTFGSSELVEGISLIPVMIGLFALTEVFTLQKNLQAEDGKRMNFPNPFIYLRYYLIQFKSAMIGTFIGILPGAGATIASLMSYTEAKRSSKNKEEYTKGSYEGLVASESANSASVGGALIPLLALGIPGSATDAVLLGAFTLHGLVAGPALFQKAPQIVYSIFLSVLLANVLILFAGSFLNRLWSKITSINRSLLNMFIILLAVIACYAIKNSLFDVYVCFAAGVLGLVLRSYRIPAPALILGLVLGGIIENSFRQVLIIGF